MKLQQKHLIPYLSYDLQIIRVLSPNKNETNIMTGITEKGIFYNQYNHIPFNHIKPVLRPLSDLHIFNLADGNRSFRDLLLENSDNEIETEFIYEIIDNIEFDKLKYAPNTISEQLDKYKFDWRFDLIKKGIALDINSLKQIK